jgi:group I intron endonuclease
MDRIELRNIEDSICGIYKITSPSGRVYIGQSINIKNRYRVHISSIDGVDTKLTRSFKKYGYESHLFEILSICNKSQLSELETHYIHKYNSLEEGLNTIDRDYTLVDTSKCKSNPKWSDERKQSHSEFLKEWWKDNPSPNRGDGFKKKISLANKGYVLAKDIDGNTIRVRKDEYDSNPNIVGITSNKKQPKLNKKIRCITDDIIFESVKDAANYYNISAGNIVSYIQKGKPLGMITHKRNLFFEYYLN